MLKVVFQIAIVIIFSFLGCQTEGLHRVGYWVQTDHLSGEDSAAVKYLEEHSDFQPELLDKGNPFSAVKEVEVLWIHFPDSNVYAAWRSDPDSRLMLESYVKDGGKLLLTDYAAFIPFDLGIEDEKPRSRNLKIEDNWLFDKKGFQSFRGHPIFTGLFGGTFVWDAYTDHRLDIIGYFEDKYPVTGQVIATGKSYITIHSDNKLVIEYSGEEGDILSVGGCVYFSRENRLQYRLERFVSNSIHYLLGNLNDSPKTYWKKFDHQPKQFRIRTDSGQEPGSLGLQFSDFHDDMVLKKENPSENFFDVSGRRALFMGKEKGGIDEIWIHPFRLMKEFRAGIIIDEELLWLDEFPVQMEVRPESFVRRYQLPAGELREIILPALEIAGGFIHYRFASDQPVRMIIKYQSDLRWMWPYDENAIGDVWYGYDSSLAALHVKDSAEDLYGIIGADDEPDFHLTGAFRDIFWENGKFFGEPDTLNQVSHAASYQLSDQNDHRLTIVISGTNTGKNDALHDYLKIRSDIQAIYDHAYAHYKNLLERALIITSPDHKFNQFWKWAIVGTDRFFVETPGVGYGLVAGYATTARGWRGGHKISGRPGYAWYFGRDSEWACFAIDGYGDFENVKRQLEFLQKFQDLSGKIFHEISTSGVVHYDAADATPLYIILAAHYVRASGDLNYLQENWISLKKAMDFLHLTDTDDDGLIENTNVGHGWVEGGKLWGAHTTFYLAALWAQALQDAAYLANLLAEESLSAQYSKESIKIREILNTEFWNDSTKFYHYGKLEDQTFIPEPTVLPAVGMYFGLLEDEKVKELLPVYAGNNFSSDWGVRILSDRSELFNPHGYHYGSVWPLFTGWTALGEYNYGNSVQGFMHIYNNLHIKNYWALGFVEEVMNGASFRPSGVCPHQCWSETNILHPAISGMVGWKPYAPEKLAVLQPRFPLHWEETTVRNLRVGESVIKYNQKTEKNLTKFSFKLMEGSPIRIQFSPEIPAGMVIDSIVIDKMIKKIPSTTYRGMLSEILELNLNEKEEVLIHHHHGVGIIPYLPEPIPGDASEGFRIVSTEYTDNIYQIKLQGTAGKKGYFTVKVYDQEIEQVEGGELITRNQQGYLRIGVTFPATAQPFSTRTITLYLN